MDMESTAGELSSHHSAVIKRRCSTPLRPSSPFCAAAAKAVEIASSHSSNAADDGGSGSNSFSIDHCSTSISTYLSETTEKEDELVECLMLLAKGICPMDELRKIRQSTTVNFSSRRLAEMETSTIPAAAGKDRYIVHECKICYRTFPSGQALGGHQTSHKKLKFTPEEITERSLALLPQSVNADQEGENARFDTKLILAPVPLQMISGDGKAGKPHECSVCGEKFLSGQALGGHMGRHRTTIITRPARNTHVFFPPNDRSISKTDSSEDVVNRSKGSLLDLNLPAPEFDHRDSNCDLV